MGLASHGEQVAGGGKVKKSGKGVEKWHLANKSDFLTFGVAKSLFLLDIYICLLESK